jgi:hypothetical protein
MAIAIGTFAIFPKGHHPMRKGTQNLLPTIVLVCASSFQCAGAARGVLCALPGETYPSDPFELDVTVSPSETAVGEPFTIKYTLRNISDQAVPACATGWNDFYILGTRRGEGQGTASLDDVDPQTTFRIPSLFSMTWEAEIRTPDVGVGEARVRGVLRSSCSLWSGSVMSAPVPLVIRAHPSR